MDWKDADEATIQKSLGMELKGLTLIDIEFISQSIEVTDTAHNSEVLSLQPDAFSFSLPNGEILSMIPISVHADVEYSGLFHL